MGCAVLSGNSLLSSSRRAAPRRCVPGREILVHISVQDSLTTVPEYSTPVSGFN